MKIVFFGFGDYGAASLSGLLDDGAFEVALVVTHPLPASANNSDLVANLATRHGIPIHYSKDLSADADTERVKLQEADAFVSTNWRRVIPPTIFNMPPFGMLNIHDALLPKYAGLGAEQWVVLEGEEETGVTVHFVTEDMDAGPIVSQTKFRIQPDATAEDIAKEQLRIYPKIICEALHLVFSDDLVTQIHSVDTYDRYHSLSEADQQLKFDGSPTSIGRQLRAWNGAFGGCWIIGRGKRYFVHEVQDAKSSFVGTPGRVVTVNSNGVAVATGRCEQTGSAGIVLQKVSTENGEVVDAKDVLKRGDQLTDSPSH